ncbi:DNA-directed RNA polymerase subunit omega [Xylocopilactobacillus apicola]|uniref:DNA-directed RNA polymerase subunit omega n=1 Tax=Xylocopilactobacillus apicola TaxID=2932184 RepID=A0AAU9CW11_9LACO|nr:DNA-directed RNA polymerase subunit omega [Xylocopilactobacillus apicola]BDR58154.1 DNA-directed RNA polymerase subunit omega [Xylocopilactobacillus apicola]
MITRPIIDNLLKQVPSRYSLAVLAAKRAHQLEDGFTRALDQYDSLKTVGEALEEIEAGKIIVKTKEQLEKENKEAQA